MSKTVLFQTIQFNQSAKFNSIWPIDRSLSGTPTPSHSGPESDSNQGGILHSSKLLITETSPSACSVSYLGNLAFFLGGGVTPLLRRCQCILQPQPTGQERYGAPCPSAMSRIVSKLADRFLGRPKVSFFNSYYTDVWWRVLLLSLNYLHLIRNYTWPNRRLILSLLDHWRTLCSYANGRF